MIPEKLVHHIGQNKFYNIGPQEDLGRPLIEFISEILTGLDQNPDLKVFFHAGETDWQGSPTDLVRMQTWS